MFFWFFMLTVSLFVPLITAFSAFVLKINPPVYKDRFYGYRTKKSMSSPEAWDFAQKYTSQLWLRLSLIESISIIIIYLFFAKKTINFLSIAGLIITSICLILIFISIIIIEISIKKKFKI